MVLENPTHLYRHLLRNAHLFRDDHTRNYLSAYIRARFNSNRYEVEGRQREKLKLGRHGLSLIKRANAGVRDPLLKLLRFSYGRIGPLRYALLKPMIEHNAKPRPPPLIEGNERSAPPPPLTPELTALLKWKGTRRQLQADIPGINSWGRPFPKNREANKRWRFNSKLMKEVPAPLLGPAYERLTRLAGNLEMPIPYKRNDVPPSSLDYKLRPLERPANRSNRFWVRIYRVLLKEVPGMQLDEEKNAWKMMTPQFYVGKKQRPIGKLEEFEGYDEAMSNPLGRGPKKRLHASGPRTVVEVEG